MRVRVCFDAKNERPGKKKIFFPRASRDMRVKRRRLARFRYFEVFNQTAVQLSQKQ